MTRAREWCVRGWVVADCGDARARGLKSCGPALDGEPEHVSGVKVTEPEEQRGWPRISTNVKIVLDQSGSSRTYRVMDFSGGGIGVRGEHPLVVNEDLCVVLYIEGTEVPTSGRVVWCKGPEDGHFTIGIKIEVAGTEAREALDRYLATL